MTHDVMRYDAIFYTKGDDRRRPEFPLRFATCEGITADEIVERCEAFFDDSRWCDFGYGANLRQERRVEVFALMPTGRTDWPDSWDIDDGNPFWQMTFLLEFVEGEDRMYAPLYLPGQKSEVRRDAFLIAGDHFERDIHPATCVWCEGYGGIDDDDVGLRWGCDACRGTGIQDGWRVHLPGYVEPTGPEPDGEIPF